MAGINRGPGGGPKRRIRTQLRSIDSTTCLVMRNRSIKSIPANWRELLMEFVFRTCGQPPRHFFGNHVIDARRFIPRPSSRIAHGSLPTGLIEFTLDREPSIARLQKRAIDWALSRSDVNLWPVPKSTSRIGTNGECFVNTGLYLHDSLVYDIRHSFNARRLDGIHGITWQHLEQYSAKRGKAVHLGIKTTCGEPCSCRTKLPELWSLGWEMHY